MTKYEQKDFLLQMIANVTDDMLSKLDKVPANWEGGELRYWIRENFNSIVWTNWQDKRSSQYRKFHNDVTTRRL